MGQKAFVAQYFTAFLGIFKPFHLNYIQATGNKIIKKKYTI